MTASRLPGLQRLPWYGRVFRCALCPVPTRTLPPDPETKAERDRTHPLPLKVPLEKRQPPDPPISTVRKTRDPANPRTDPGPKRSGSLILICSRDVEPFSKNHPAPLSQIRYIFRVRNRVALLLRAMLTVSKWLSGTSTSLIVRTWGQLVSTRPQRDIVDPLIGERFSLTMLRLVCKKLICYDDDDATIIMASRLHVCKKNDIMCTSMYIPSTNFQLRKRNKNVQRML